MLDNQILLEEQKNKKVEADYIREQGKKFPNYFFKPADYSSYTEAYLGGKKTKIRSPQKQKSHRGYDILRKLRGKYKLSNPSKLLSFFEKNSYLIPVVIEAYEELKERFPSEKLVLEVVSDSEDDSCDELFAYINTSLPVEEALQKLDDLDEQWFLNKLDETKGLFNFNLKFV